MTEPLPRVIQIALAQKWIESIEWSMGNGQCPECAGLRPDMHWGAGRDKDTGHLPGCGLALTMKVLDLNPKMSTSTDDHNNHLMSGRSETRKP